MLAVGNRLLFPALRYHFRTSILISASYYGGASTSQPKMSSPTKDFIYNKHNDAIPENVIDLRSDTVTRPCQAMRDAMSNAVVGDDVYKDDPTVNNLESECARLFGKEEALFVTSGTMANLLAVMCHTSGRGDEIIVGDQQHIFKYEQGNYAQFAGVSASIVPNAPDGTIPIDVLRSAIRDPSDSHYPLTKLICLENTHNQCGGRVLPLSYLKQVRELADEAGLQVHIDGARIMNAAVAMNKNISDIAQYADSVSMCFSKSLGCPIGSILVGSQSFISKACRLRKALGGGWRQAGVIAAPCLFAIKNAPTWLTVDNANAREIAKQINDKLSPYLSVIMDDVETNIIKVHMSENRTQELCGILSQSDGESRKVLLAPLTEDIIRIVTHRGFSSSEIPALLSQIERAVTRMKQ